MRGTIFSGRVAEEGPYQEINQSDGETLSYKSKQWRWSSSKEIREEDNIGDSIGSNANLLETLPDPSTKKGKAARLQSLKTKLTAKIYDNLVTSVNDVHIRCEIPEGGLNMGSQEPVGTKNGNGDTSTSATLGKSDQRTFAFGLTLKSLSVKNVSEDESPVNDVNRDCLDLEANDSSSSSDKTHKQIEIKDLAMYWDDNPSFILSESDLLNGLLSLLAATCQRHTSKGAKQMSVKQDPGLAVIKSLSKTNPQTKAIYRRVN